MAAAERDCGTEYLRELGRVARRARLAAVLRRLVPGSLAGLAAGFVFLAVRPFLPAAFTLGHPLAVPGLLLAAGWLAGALIGSAVRIGRPALAVQADRSLGTRGLASAALEVAEGRRSSAFAGPLLEDASSTLRAAGPKRIIGRPRLPLLPWTLAAVVLVIAAGLLPFRLPDLFPARPPVCVPRYPAELRPGHTRVREILPREGAPLPQPPRHPPVCGRDQPRMALPDRKH